MILVFSWYPFGPNLFQALHGASMRHSLNVLAVQVRVIGSLYFPNDLDASTQTTNHMVVDVSGFSGSGGSYKRCEQAIADSHC
jgi:hypothetical protein